MLSNGRVFDEYGRQVGEILMKPKRLEDYEYLDKKNTVKSSDTEENNIDSLAELLSEFYSEKYTENGKDELILHPSFNKNLKKMM